MKQWFIIGNDKIPYLQKELKGFEIIEQCESQSKVSIEVTSTNLLSLVYSGVRFGMDVMIESKKQQVA